MTDKETRIEMQHAAINEVQDEIETRHTHVSGGYGIDGVVDAESLDMHDGTKRYLEGYSDALSWAVDQVDGIHRLNPPQTPVPYGLDDIENELFISVLETIITEAKNDNWGNVKANIDRLEETADDAGNDDENGGDSK